MTMVFIICILSLSLIVHRRFRIAFIASCAEKVLDAQLDDRSLGLAKGLALLETGVPVSGQTPCCLTLSDGAEVALSYSQVVGSTWTVTADTSTQATNDICPGTPPMNICPGTFGGQSI
jgi:hypothetical protein